MKEEIILDLHRIGAIKFGEFKLKSGMMSPIYIDLRIIVSYPDVLKKIATAMTADLKNIKCDVIAGIPYTAIPIATVISVETNTPMIYARKEVKDYGTKRKIEGVYKKGATCAVIDDLITTGDSKIETAEPFEAEGLIIKDFIVLIDREQGGKKILEEKGYNLHRIICITDLLDVLHGKEKISKSEYEKAKNFIDENKVA